MDAAPWRFVWCSERCFKDENLDRREKLGDFAQERCGKLLCMRKAKRFGHWLEAQKDERFEPYVLLTDWREAKPCLKEIIEIPQATQPTFMVVFCETQMLVKRVQEWSAAVARVSGLSFQVRPAVALDLLEVLLVGSARALVAYDGFLSAPDQVASKVALAPGVASGGLHGFPAHDRTSGMEVAPPAPPPPQRAAMPHPLGPCLRARWSYPTTLPKEAAGIDELLYYIGLLQERSTEIVQKGLAPGLRQDWTPQTTAGELAEYNSEESQATDRDNEPLPSFANSFGPHGEHQQDYGQSGGANPFLITM